MNALELLENDHQKVRMKLKDISNNDYNAQTKRKMFSALSKELLLHEEMEHAVWYPYFKDNDKLDQTVRHLISEEKHAEKAIKKITSIQDDQQWEEEFLQFKQDVEHHAAEEEKSLFPKINKLFTSDELEAIGQEMLTFKTLAIAKLN